MSSRFLRNILAVGLDLAEGEKLRFSGCYIHPSGYFELVVNCAWKPKRVQVRIEGSTMTTEWLAPRLKAHGFDVVEG